MSETITKAMDDLRARRDHLRRELGQVESALAALEQIGASENGSDRPELSDARAAELEWVRLDRTEAIRRVLAEFGRPVPRKRLVDTLQRRGRIHDDPENVSATLSYMKRIGEVDNPATGTWTLTDKTAEGSDTSAPDE